MKRQLNLPTILTWMRVWLIPVFVVVFYLPNALFDDKTKNIVATIIFIIAMLTDYLDGYLARKLKQESSFGAFLDPVADKAIVATSLVLLVHLGRTYVIAAIVIIIREIAISALREWMAQLGKLKNVAVAYIGKLKTAAQMFAIMLLILDCHTRVLGNLFMWIAVILTVISMFYYLKQAKKQFSE
jgi:cardiolipin synthase